MINRRYFVSVEKFRPTLEEGSSYNCILLSKRSFFPQPERVLDSAIEKLEKSLKDDNYLGGIQVLAFNRI